MKAQTPRLLLVGGTDDDAGWIHRALAIDNRTVRLERLSPSDDPRPLLSSSRFDALLVDLYGSRLDAQGWVALLEEIGRPVPLVVVADARQESDVAEWMATGASAWIFRPGLLGLSAVLARLLREAREEAATEEKERQLREATAGLIELTRSAVFRGTDLVAKLQEITQRCVRTIGVDRAGIWLYSEDRSALELADAFDVTTGLHTQGVRLSRAEHPRYFEALAANRVIAATAALTDSRTREFAESSLRPQNICSTLDVALSLRGELRGVICVGHRGAPRRWTAAEEVFSTALADVVLLALEAAERVKVESALAASERRFRDVFHYSSDNILLYRVSADGRVFCEDANPAVESSTGLGRDQLIGKEAREVLPPTPAALLEARHRQAIRARVPISYEHELPLPNGARIYNTAIIPVLDDVGRVHRLASVARDVTLLRTSERLARELEAQLAETQKTEALMRLASHVAHDVASLLSVIEAHAGQLTKEPGAGAPQAILEATSRGRALVQRIASVGRGEPEEKRPVELEPLVREVVRQVSAMAPAVELVVEASGGVLVNGDPAQLHQVVLNLSANALQAMPNGGRLTIEIGLRELSPHFAAAHPPLRPGSCARLAVSDTGRGMDEATRRRAFEPFFSTTQGSGLGLSVVQSVVAGHEGAIVVSTAPGKGASFEVFLPSHAASPAVPARHLMLVDDHPGMAKVSAKLLETIGYRTTVFDDPRVALEAFRRAPTGFDAVLTDLSMPQMSGVEFARSLRLVRPDLPVIVSSGLATSPNEELAAMGVTAVLLKPWRLDEAVATLDRVFAGPAH